jgi:hypothetical protein
MNVKLGSLMLSGEERVSFVEKRVLGRTFSSKTNEVEGVWRKLYEQELCKLYRSSDICRISKSNSKEWAAFVAGMA